MRRSHGDSKVIVVERGGGGLSWLLAGAALGAGLALLFAPARGSETRKRLAKQLGRLRESAEDVFDEFREAVDPDLSVARPRGADEGGVDETAEAETARPPRGGSTARVELERRLSAARARRQRALAADDEEPAS